MVLVSAAPRLLHLFQGWLWGLPNQCRFRVGGTLSFYCFYPRSLLLTYSLFVYFIYVFIVSLLNGFPMGLCILGT